MIDIYNLNKTYKWLPATRVEQVIILCISKGCFNKMHRECAVKKYGEVVCSEKCLKSDKFKDDLGKRM